MVAGAVAASSCWAGCLTDEVPEPIVERGADGGQVKPFRGTG